jgi:integrase
VATTVKPRKPYPDFPLFPHSSGQWAKTINRKTYYFGKWDDWRAALKRYLNEHDALRAGRARIEGTTLAEALNSFLEKENARVKSREIRPRTFRRLRETCDRLIKEFGEHQRLSEMGPAHFEDYRARLCNRGWAPVTIRNEIADVRTVFGYINDSEKVATPIRLGKAFRGPSLKVLREYRQKKGPRYFEAAEIRAVLEIASSPLRAMILLGINCGLGNEDCAELKPAIIKDGWLDFPRPKNAIPRRCPLWLETVAALAAVPRVRSDLIFVTRFGNPWKSTGQSSYGPISIAMARLLKRLKLHRPGLNFYALRHTFQTIGENAGDGVARAVNYIMGHTPLTRDMGAVYREKPPSDDQLRTVTDHVHAWLFG